MRHPWTHILGSGTILLPFISLLSGLPVAPDGGVDVQISKQAFRQYTCIVHQELEPADCRLTFMTEDDEPSTITDSGCFTEKEPLLQQLRNYCPLQCSGASFAFITSHRPTTPSPLLNQEANLTNTAYNQQVCTASTSFDVIKRRKDWFLWRSDDCLSTEAQFDIGCVFTAGRLAGEDGNVAKKFKDGSKRLEAQINSGEAKLNSVSLPFSITNGTSNQLLNNKEAELDVQQLIQLRSFPALSSANNYSSTEPAILDQADLVKALNGGESGQKDNVTGTTESMEGSGQENQ